MFIAELGRDVLIAEDDLEPPPPDVYGIAADVEAGGRDLVGSGGLDLAEELVVG